MKKKCLAAVLAALLAGASLAGCTVGKTQEAAELEPEVIKESEEPEHRTVTLRVWSEEANFDLLTKMIESFQEEYAGQAEFDIQLEASSDASTKDDFLADVHNGPDVFPFADDQLSAMVAAGAIAPVDNAEEVRAANLEDAAAAASVNGVLYGYPMTADNGYFMYYDKNYFTQEDVKTLDGMLAVAEAAEKQITMDWSSGWYLYSFFGNTGMEFGVNEDGVTNYCSWNTTEGAVKGTDIAQAMLSIAASPSFKNCGDEEFLAGVRNGSVIAGVSGAWNAVEIKNAWGADYGAVKLPSYTCAGQQIQMASFKGYKMMGVNEYSKEKEWAFRLADWFTNEENQTLRFVERNQGPSNIKAAASDAVHEVPAIQAVIAQAEFGRLQRVGNSYWDACSSFGQIMAGHNPNQTDLQELMDTLVKGITASVVQ